MRRRVMVRPPIVGSRQGRGIRRGGVRRTACIPLREWCNRSPGRSRGCRVPAALHRETTSRVGARVTSFRCVPRCDGQARRCFVTENRHALDRIQRRHDWRYPRCTDPPRPQRLHPLTAEFLAGQTPTGRRNTAAFAAACNLLGNGLPLHEVECQILHGARGCELPEREAHSAIQSALRAVEQSQ